jgi:L-lysine exporter family protein LysE/ArgO
MTEAIFYGMLTGAVMSVMLGTVFFALVQNSIEHGAKTGFLISLGVILSDVILISIAYFNAALIPEGGTTENIVRIAGTLFLFIYGINNLRSNKKVFYPKTRRGKALVFISTGFLLNILNPGNLIGWVAVSAYVTKVAEYKGNLVLLFFTGSLFAIFIMEMLIALGASHLKDYLTTKVLRTIDRVIGLLFLCFAIVVIWPLVLKWLE